jgi:DNA polymerase III epsilon subunit-like protein
MCVSEARLAYLDVETTGRFPAMGDRVVEVGIVVCHGQQEIEFPSRLVNPETSIPADARRIHGIRDRDVADCPPFAMLAPDVCHALRNACVAGHNVPFDIGFVAMEVAMAGCQAKPRGCLDTRQLAGALWDLPDYQLDTVAAALGIKAKRSHRALDDAQACRAILHRVIDDLGGWSRVTSAELEALRTYPPSWPSDPRRLLPGPIYDALANGGELAIRCVNGDGLASTRSIQPVACFSVGRYTYVRACCSKVAERKCRPDPADMGGVRTRCDRSVRRSAYWMAFS